ncbi:MAG TPA: hypothetical protein VKB89_25205 [Xanthobacteraceae bacterium]|nr:hypothetical protein [Xanthobacteraceae bacterium]
MRVVVATLKKHETEDQKERQYKAWLRATLQRFAEDVRDIESRNKAEDAGKNGAS